MRDRKVELRDATPGDIKRWYNGPPPVSMRAQVLEVDGELLAIWGVQSTQGEVVCFSTIKPEARVLKREVVKGIRMMRKLLQQYAQVIAFATEAEPTSENFIKHVGFVYAGESAHGRVYSWVRQQYLYK